MSEDRQRREPPKLDEDLEEELTRFRDDPDYPICIAHSYDCDGVGGGSVHGFVRHHFGSLDHNADHERHTTQHTPARRAGRP